MGRYFKLICKTLCFGLLLLVVSDLQAQVSFNKIPIEFSIIPRNPATNSGNFELSGTVSDNKYTVIEVRAYQRGVLKGKASKSLYFSGSSSSFDLKLNQPAGLINYDLRVYLFEGSKSSLVKEIKSLAFGDIILITGQSNAVANSYNGTVNSKYRDSFIRSFGTAGLSGTTGTDLNWYLADGDGYYDKGTVGQWGLILAKQILDSVKVPVGIINNAVGGTPVTYHQKNYSNPTDLNTSYGRQLFRAIAAGVNGKARFMFYYQGESDGANYRLHDSVFRMIHKDWRNDFAELEKIYVVQVRSGCGNPTIQLREVQRNFEFTLPITRTLTMTGFNGHDGCHFALKNGYESLGFEAANCLLADFYSKKSKKDIYPLSPLHAYFSKSDYSQITLELSKDVQSLKADANFYQLFQLEGNPGVSIIGGSIANNKIVLNLSGKVCSIEGLSYDGKAGSQPWVTNNNGIGLLSFYKLPVYATRRYGNLINLCNEQTFAPKIDTIAGYTYLWKGKTSKVSSPKTWPVFKPQQSEIFELIMQDRLKACKADTQLYYINVESVKKPNFPPSAHLCPGDSLNLGLNYTAVSYLWKKDTKEISETESIVIKEKGTYSVYISTSSGCHNADTIRVGQSFPAEVLDPLYFACPETPLLLKTKHPFKSYCWNKDSMQNNDSLYVKSGIVRIVAVDSASCIYKDSAMVKNHTTKEIILETKPEFCDYGFYRYLKPASSKSWFLNAAEILKPYLYINENDSGLLRLLDSNACRQDFYLKPNVIKKPYENVSLFRMCSGQAKTILLNNKNTYRWADGDIGYSKTVYKPGIYKYDVTISSCEYKDSIEVLMHLKPVWNIPEDTIICKGAHFSYPIPESLSKVEINGIVFKDSLKITHGGTYEIKGLDSLDCTYNWNIKVTEKNCLIHLSPVLNNRVVLYPNPANDILRIESNLPIESMSLSNFFGQTINLGVLSKTNNQLILDMTGLSRGIYFISIKTNSGIITRKILKE